VDYDDALEYMHGRLRLGVKLGNARMEALLGRLGRPQEKLRVVHIAGTKGKGSTAAMCAAMLQAAGYRVGQYLSPYVYDVRERVQINAEPIPRADFARWITTIKPHIDALEVADFGPTTEFELKTAVGLCWFAEQAVDYAVLEVGLGGRLDATNVVAHPLVSVITSIGYDHMELLGHTLPEIAAEKAGIVKPGVPCVTGVPVETEAYDTIARICRERNAPLLRSAAVRAAPDGTLTFTTPRRALTGARLRLRGAFQHGNAAAAIAALDAVAPGALPLLADDAMRAGLAQATLPGRLEHVGSRPTIVVDGAHNAMAAEALASALREEYHADTRRLILVVGLKRNHDPGTFLPPLAALRPALLIATEPGFQPRPASDIATAARRCDMSAVQVVASSPIDAARAALAAAGPDDLICVTGSFYTVGDIPPAQWARLLAERNL